MKIAEFSDSFMPIVDGVGTVVMNYANQIAAKGHECYVMAPLADTGYRGSFPFEIVEFNSIPLYGLQYKLGIPVTDASYNYRLNKINLDIIHAHSPFIAGQSAYKFAKKKGIPLVGTFHSKYKDDFRQVTGMDSMAYVGSKFVVEFFNKCDEVWAVSENSAETLKSYGYKKPVVIMPNGTGAAYFTPSCQRMAEARYELGKRPVFLYVGQMSWKKNIERILKAAAEVSKRGLDFDLVFVGHGPNFDEIVSMVKLLGIEENTVITGHIFDLELLSGLYRCADLFVFPSLYDTSGLVVREAAQNGTASVVVAGSAPAEVVLDGVNGFTCKDETADLARVMEYAINNPRETEKLGTEAMKTIPEGWDGIIDKVLERYEYIIERHKSKR